MVFTKLCSRRLNCLKRTISLLEGRSVGYVSFSTETSTEINDVTICGGGMVGNAAALAIGDSAVLGGLKVTLLEEKGEKEYKQPELFSNRVCALTKGSQTFLNDIGAWNVISKYRFGRSNRMQVWDGSSDATISFTQDQDDVAFIVENDLIIHSLQSKLRELFLPNLQTKFSCKVKHVKLPSDDEDSLVEVKLEDGSIILTKLLIAADGVNSSIREKAKIKTFKFDYNQLGLVATLHVSKECENTVAWQRFLPNGPIALLPLGADRSSLVWSTSIDHAKRLMEMSEDDFVDAVNQGFWSTQHKNGIATYLGQAFDNILVSAGLEGSQSVQLPPTVEGVDEKSRAIFPLGLSHALHYIKPRLALIGDAAHRVHPLAGQGVNLGFGDVKSLVENLVSTVLHGADPGSFSHLLDYERDRQRHVLPVMAAIDGLHRLYRLDQTPLVALRSVGLQATNACKPVKDFLIREASN